MAGGLFILPGVVAIMALSWIYALWGGVGVVAGLFFGLKAAVLAIVAQAAARLAGRALRSRPTRLIAAAAFAAIFFLAAPFPLIVAAAGLIGLWRGRAGDPAFIGAAEADGALAEPTPAHAAPSWRRFAVTLAIWGALWLVPVALLLARLGPENVFSQIAVFFSKMALVTFGGAYAALAYVAQQAVERFGWLAPGEMLDGLGMAETTPGPLIMVLQFVGFMAAFRAPGEMSPLLAGTLGGLLATWVTFAPCFLWIFAGAPFVEATRGNRALKGALAAVGAAVVGVIFNLAIWFAVHTLFREVVALRGYGFAFDLPKPSSLDPWALALALAAGLALIRFKAGMATTLAACAMAGALLRLAGWA
jgi:chromate transporter